MPTKTEINLPTLPGRPIPNQKVELLIHVNEDYCSAPNRIKKWHNQWMTLSIPEIVSSATVHFQGASLRRALNESKAQAQKRRAWERLWDHNPRGQSANGRTRLILNKGNNSDEQGQVSFLLGDALGVAAMKQIFKISLNAFKKRNFSQYVRHDFDVVVGRKILRLETRGRFDANNRSTAIDEVEDKFGHSRSFTQAIGALIYPSENPDRNRPDIELLDPEDTNAYLSNAALARHILRYYLDLLLDLGATASNLIRVLLKLNDADLIARLKAGVEELQFRRNDRNQSTGLWGPTRFTIGEDEFWGVKYDNMRRPSWIKEELREKDVVLFWGIWHGVLARLGTISLFELMNMLPRQFVRNSIEVVQTHEARGGTTLILHDDGVLVACVPRSLVASGDRFIDWNTFDS